MRPPEIRLLDFSDSRGSAASLIPILMRTAAVNRVACTISRNGSIDGPATTANSRCKTNDVFVIVLPAPLQERAASVLHYVKHEFPTAPTIIVLELEEPDCVMDLMRSGA